MFGLPEEAEAELAGRSAGQQQQQQQPALTLSTLPQQSGSPSLREPHAQVLGSPRGRRMSNGRRRGAVPRPPPSATVAGGASGLSPAMEEDHNLAVTLARDTESGSGAPEAGLSPFLSRPASFSVLRRPNLSEARPGAVSARAPQPRRSAAATTSACPAPSAYDDDCRANLYHRLDATPPYKRRRVAADPDVVDLTADSPVVVGTPERPSTRGSEVEVVGFRAPPSEEVQVVDTREPIDSLWHSLTTSPTRADHSSRAYRRRPIRMGSRRSGPSVYGPTSSGVAPPDSALRCGGPGYPPGRWDSSDPRRKYVRGGPGGGAAAEGGMDRDSKELAEMLQEEEDRFAALSAYRHDVDLHARLEELHAQETQAQRERWTQSMQNYTRSRIAETLYRHSSIPSRDQLREQLRESMMGHSASRHAHLAGGYGWNRGHHSSAALASPGFGDLLFGGAFPPMQQLHYLSHQVQAIRQVREGRLPAHMLLSDRDFDENDYEALLALDEGVENRKGATESVINQLPTEMVAPSPTKAACTLERCTVCLEDPQAGEVLRSLPCHHKFHKHCIDKWLSMKASCPICLCDIK